MGRRYSFFRVTLLALLFTAAFPAAPAAQDDDEDFGFHAYPNPFIIGFNEANIEYWLPQGGTVSIYVYSFEGNLVRTLLADERHRAGGPFGGLTWDGIDAGGREVGPGPYTLVLEVRMQGKFYRETFVSIANK